MEREGKGKERKGRERDKGGKGQWNLGGVSVLALVGMDAPDWDVEILAVRTQAELGMRRTDRSILLSPCFIFFVVFVLLCSFH